LVVVKPEPIVLGPKLPQISGIDLAKILVKDGWEIKRRSTHGLAFSKEIGGRHRITIVPHKRQMLPPGTLGAILRQADMTVERLLALM
jgi:predicted RNA binding protein YcfA (HicA-like mRNA interferase family)